MKTEAGKTQKLTTPVQIRLDIETSEKIKRIAAANHLSIVDVMRIALRESIPAIEQNGLTIKPAA